MLPLLCGRPVAGLCSLLVAVAQYDESCMSSMISYVRKSGKLKTHAYSGLANVLIN